MSVIDVHADSLATSTELSDYYVEGFIKPIDVISVLNNARISYMLVGAHGLGGWMQKPRATQDVDVLVASRHHKKAVKTLLASFPQLQADDLPVVTRLRNAGTKKVVIDVMKTNQELFRHALKYTHTVESEGQSYRIPSLEMALAMKFAPMVSIYRLDIDKYQDAHDFGQMVYHNPNIDMRKLAELGNFVYPEGGKELIEMVRRIRAGEKLQL